MNVSQLKDVLYHALAVGIAVAALLVAAWIVFKCDGRLPCPPM